MPEVILRRFAGWRERAALVWQGQTFTYGWLADEVAALEGSLAVGPRSVVGLNADYSPRALALLFALLGRGCVVVPLAPGSRPQRDALYALAEVGTELVLDDADALTVVPVGHAVTQPMLAELLDRGTGGLVLFSSGSAGKIKGVVHDGAKLVARYATPRRPAVIIPFMLFDHIGGMNTVLHTLSSGGTAVLAKERSPEAICRLIAAHRVEVLPATPTFLNLLLLSDHHSHDLSSLQILGYGAERMPEATLARLTAAFPGVHINQNYGLSEAGILHTRSEASGSLWMKLGGDGVEVRVQDGLLELKVETAMVGYLNEASPFTEDGWLKTGDRVEVRGEYIRVLGRESDIIIVGGEKVYPAEIEDLIAQLPDVLDVVVSGEPHAITGNIVKATVQLASGESRAEFRRRMSAALTAALPGFKVPQKVEVTTEPLHTARWKKRRA
ncbi:MAG: long-chain fatty acid--CoA ligase [Deltaproteobacteria bacterium]|nr:long-chain fatty acid--CoA ligase [Deltaproteobacteria bacterium]